MDLPEREVVEGTGISWQGRGAAGCRAARAVPALTL